MATRKVTLSANGQPPNAEEVIAALDALPAALQQQVLSRIVMRRSGRGPLARQIGDHFRLSRSVIGKARTMIQALLGRLLSTTLELRRAVNELEHRKRKPSAAGGETVEEFQTLRATGMKYTVALKRLVQLPTERNKPHAVNYRKSQDLEALRQTIKNMESRRRRAAAKRTVVEDSLDNALTTVIELILEM